MSVTSTLLEAGVCACLDELVMGNTLCFRKYPDIIKYTSGVRHTVGTGYLCVLLSLLNDFHVRRVMKEPQTQMDLLSKNG